MRSLTPALRVLARLAVLPICLLALPLVIVSEILNTVVALLEAVVNALEDFGGIDK